ncbi:MAG: hypothetical protein KBB86_03510 [Candidatus Pacebacteria bacterium]|nr:hypothetical protein [Candidatus Paceibacterota bacterium]
MNLEEILKSNGTGLLEGLCRIHNRKLDFDEEPKQFSSEFEVDFSLGAQSLGMYKIEVTATSFEEKLWTGEIKLDKGESIYLEINYSKDPDLGRFYAVLL